MASPDDNPIAALPAYYLRNLVAHLEAADRYEDLHRLLALETSQERNAWFEAKEAIADTQGYLDDIARVLLLSIRRSWVDRREIGSSLRYALIVTSLNSLAQSIPPALLVALVDRGIWTPDQGLGWVHQIADQHAQQSALAALLPLLVEMGKPDKALQAACAVEDEWTRVELLVALASYLAQPHLEEILAVARELVDEDARLKVLAELVHLAPTLASQDFLAAVEKIADESLRAEVLIELIGRQAAKGSDQALNVVLDGTRGITDASWRAWVLVELVSQIPQGKQSLIVHEALATAREMDHGSSQAEVLMELAHHLPEEQQLQVMYEVLAAAYEISDSRSRAGVLVQLAPYLSPKQCAQVMDDARLTVQQIGDGQLRAEVLVALIPLCSQDARSQILQDALAEVQNFKDRTLQTRLLVSLVPHFPKGGCVPILRQILTRMEDIADEQLRAQVLAEVMSCLPESMVQAGLAATRECCDDWLRAKVLAKLLPRVAELGYPEEALSCLPESMVQAGLAATRECCDDWLRAKVLAKLLPRVAELGYPEEALSVAFTDGNEWLSPLMLAELVPHLQEPLRRQALHDALEATQEIEPDWWRGKMLVKLVPFLSGKDLVCASQIALTAAGRTSDESWRSEIVTGLVSHLSEPLLHEALAVARRIGDEQAQAKVLWDLLPLLVESGYAEDALIAARETADCWRRAELLARLVAWLPQRLMHEIMVAAREIEVEEYQWRVLVQVFARATDQVYREKVFLWAAEIEGNALRVKVLAEIAPNLPEQLLEDVITATCGFSDASTRARVLAKLLPRQAELGYPEHALAAARKISDEWWRSEVIAGLAPFLTEPCLQEALSAAREIQDEWLRSQALAKLLSQQARLGLADEAFAAVSEIPVKSQQVIALAGLAPWLLRETGIQALQLAVNTLLQTGDIWDSREAWRVLAAALAEMASHLPESLVREALAALRSIDLDQMLEQGLISLLLRLMELGYPEEAFATAQEILNHDVMADLAPHFPETLVQEAVEAAQDAEDDEEQAYTLMGLLPALAERGRLEDALVIAQRIRGGESRVAVLSTLALRLTEDRDEDSLSYWRTTLSEMVCLARKPMFQYLTRLLPVVTILGGPEAISETHRAIHDVGRWWP